MNDEAKRLEEYNELIAKVETISVEAANYLRRLLVDKEEAERVNFSLDSVLLGIFIWNDTPQGVDYWLEIEELIEI